MRLSHIAFAAAALLAGTTQAQAADYTIDGTHTFATFEIGHFGTTTNRGRFDKKEGKLEFDRAGKSGKVEVVIDITSINTGTTAFNQHLQSADFLMQPNSQPQNLYQTSSASTQTRSQKSVAH